MSKHKIDLKLSEEFGYPLPPPSRWSRVLYWLMVIFTKRRPQ